MIISAVLVVFGLALGITATQLWDLRLSGVIVVPLFAIYTLYDVAAFPVLLVSVAVAYWGLVTVTEHTLLYGRQLLYAAILAGAVVPYVVLLLTATVGIVTYSVEMYALGSILPGVAAYNLYRVDRERRVDDVVASAAAYVALVVLGAAFVSRTTASWFGDWSPVLFAPAADVARFRDVVMPGGGLEIVHDPLVGLGVVFFGLFVALFVETVWRVRLVGIIALPLLALFVVAHPLVLAFYVGSASLTYAIIQLLHRQTLVYGRVLLSIAVITAVFVAIPVAAIVPIPGQYLLFTALLAGIGGYNVHRLSPATLRRSIRLSVSLLSGLVLVVSILSTVPAVPGGAVTVTVLCGLALVPGLVTAAQLEDRRRRDKQLLELEVRPQ